MSTSNNKESSLAKKWVLPTSFSLVGILIGISICYFAFPAPGMHDDCVSSLKFIRPTIDCDVSDGKADELSGLGNKIEDMVDIYKKEAKADRIGVFVRDLKTSRFVGVNDGDTFIMASLLKLPLIIAGYKLAEIEPRILENKVVYTGTPNLYDEQNFEVADKLMKGKTYTVEELMHRSLKYSDNTATQLLAMQYAPGYLDKVLQGLGIQIVRPEGSDENIVTARAYANVFRILYNASYLTTKYSNDVLTMLTDTEYVNGAVSKLPKDIVIAHKFAERASIDPKTKEVKYRQLHECGIVYAKNGDDAYIFCIMTEGQKFEDLEKIQQDISYEIYNSLVNTYQ